MLNKREVTSKYIVDLLILNALAVALTVCLVVII
ncbi:putative membrane protein (plasmid) [Clostridium botulinum]|uniref:Putative membrane protein n=1 Tax=Clostridium botulinum TaxID=1491 RepID=A0A1L7JNB3_CLOBO|nr:putative membrane protein [Clostridium botulinum]